MRHCAKLSIAAAAALSLSSAAIAREADQVIMPEDPQINALFEQFGFSEAVIHGDTVYLSGVVAGPAADGMTEEQVYEEAFARIGRTLERSGSSFDDVVEITTFHVDLEASAAAFVAVKNRYLTAPFPAWTAIDIDRLFIEGALVEIKIVARITPTSE
ncbi:MAG: RidA family protein [Erythrobacter sp.]